MPTESATEGLEAEFRRIFDAVSVEHGLEVYAESSDWLRRFDDVLISRLMEAANLWKEARHG